MKAAINILLSGIERERDNMRNWSISTVVIIAFALSLAAAGCAPKSPAGQTTETTPSGQPSAGAGAATPAAPGQQAIPGQPQTAAPGQAAGGFDKVIYFEYDSFDVTPESSQTLDNLVEFLKANPELRLQIAGNCDERGTTEYNLALGDKRARAAKDYCVTKGIDDGRLSTVSYGEEKPVDPGHTEEAWAKNRRDDFLFSK
jgi:peptidoglycan-associated lipoprotein